MHLIIANIPHHFHSSDLRNFFSEAIEKETFNCFHFRHRPQTNLLNIIKNSISNPSSNGNPNDAANAETESKCIRNNSEDDKSSVSGVHDPQTPQQGRTSNQSECENGGGLTQTQDNPSDSDSTSCVHNRVRGSEGEDDGGGSSNPKTHWLSSGLAGLASLISEKKKQARESDKWSKCVQGSDGRTQSGVKGSQREVKGDGGRERVGASDPHFSSLEEVLSPHQEDTDKRTCCVVEVKDSCGEVFMRRYGKKHWVTRSGDILPQRCYVLRVDFTGTTTQSAITADYKTREELSALSLTYSSPQSLLEFQPPPIMPQGNVGTPTTHFKKLIRTCKMPGALIKKLGLEFTRGRRKRRFGQVPFDYGTSVFGSHEDSQNETENNIAFTASGHLIPSSADFEEQQKKRRRERKKGTLPKGPRLELEKEGEDGAEVEEWERYEPFHEDVTSQDRIKERRFEEELEVVWEKGGSGLVFYTDAQYWRAQEGDFDEQTADEWDVDMSVYYEEGAGDLDARAGLDMRNSDKLRAGKLTSSAFIKKKEKEMTSAQGKRDRGRRIGPTMPPTIGKFEAHTRGFGRRIMEAQGWQDGQGLGVGSAGMPYALEGDGQHPHERKGFGYHGVKLQGWTSASSSLSSRHEAPHRHHRISTVFDHTEDADPPSHPLRTPEPTALKHRPR